MNEFLIFSNILEMKRQKNSMNILAFLLILLIFQFELYLQALFFFLTLLVLKETWTRRPKGIIAPRSRSEINWLYSSPMRKTVSSAMSARSISHQGTSLFFHHLLPLIKSLKLEKLMEEILFSCRRFPCSALASANNICISNDCW